MFCTFVAASHSRVNRKPHHGSSSSQDSVDGLLQLEEAHLNKKTQQNPVKNIHRFFFFFFMTCYVGVGGWEARPVALH